MFLRERLLPERGQDYRGNSRGQLVAPVAGGFGHSRDTEIRPLISRWIELSEAPAMHPHGIDSYYRNCIQSLTATIRSSIPRKSALRSWWLRRETRSRVSCIGEMLGKTDSVRCLYGKISNPGNCSFRRALLLQFIRNDSSRSIVIND